MTRNVLLLSLLAFAGAFMLGAFLFRRDVLHSTLDQSLVRQSIQPYKASVTKDPDLAALVNRTLSIKSRITLDMPTRFTSVKDADDIPVLVTVLKDFNDDDTVRNEVANLLRRSKYLLLDQTLIEIADEPKNSSRMRAFAIQHLGGSESRSDAAMPRLRMALYDRSPEVRREALWALVERGDQLGVDAAIKCLQDSSMDSEPIRDLAISCMQKLDRRDQIPTIRKYLCDKNEATRIAAIVSLSQWGDGESRPAIEEAAMSPIVRLQRAGKAALARLDKQSPN